MALSRSLLRDVPPSPESFEEDIDIEETFKGTSDSDEETSEAAMELQPTAPVLKQSSVSKKKDKASASYSKPTMAVASKLAKSKHAATPEKPSLVKWPREAEGSKHTKKNKNKKKISEAVDGGRKNSKEEVPKKARFLDHFGQRVEWYMERAVKALESMPDSEPKKAELEEELKKIEDAKLDVLLKENELCRKQAKFAIEILVHRR